eukprot:scaffold2940_cov63-Phaeocystis_antarctica.AAC.9
MVRQRGQSRRPDSGRTSAGHLRLKPPWGRAGHGAPGQSYGRVAPAVPPLTGGRTPMHMAARRVGAGRSGRRLLHPALSSPPELTAAHRR